MVHFKLVRWIWCSNIVQCAMAMGDLQILTGLSILVSGYIQLSNGLSSYHWMVIIDLAWFSCLTHLACLTLLRNFLYNHPLQRTVRLFFMGVLAILLVVGLSFTSRYTWVSFDYYTSLTEFMAGPPFSSYPDPVAITYHATCQIPNTTKDPDWQYLSTVFSIVLIAMGLLSRVIKLYRFISVGVCARLRSWVSTRIRRYLRWVFSRCCFNKSPRSLSRTLIYRPLLAVFVVAELGLDWWSSFLLEVRRSRVHFLIIL